MNCDVSDATYIIFLGEQTETKTMESVQIEGWLNYGVFFRINEISVRVEGINQQFVLCTSAQALIK